MDGKNTKNKYCIIGAGSSGLAAAKNLKALGIPYDIFEREEAKNAEKNEKNYYA